MAKLNLNRLKSVLAEKNKTSKELAAYIEKTEATVSRWCTNEVQPSIETLYDISKWLKMDIRELLVSTGEVRLLKYQATFFPLFFSLLIF